MPRKTTLTQLEEREAAAQQRLEAERKTLRAIQAKRAAAEKRAQTERYLAVGKLVEEMGLPIDDLVKLTKMLKTLDPHFPMLPQDYESPIAYVEALREKAGVTV